MKRKKFSVVLGRIQIVAGRRDLSETSLKRAAKKLAKAFGKKLGDIDIIFDEPRIFESNYKDGLKD